jgi:hypothetical protein
LIASLVVAPTRKPSAAVQALLNMLAEPILSLMLAD